MEYMDKLINNTSINGKKYIGTMYILKMYCYIEDLFHLQPIKLDWWPITRDSIIYCLTVTMLLVMSNDEMIQWYEAMLLLIFYIVYFLIMWQNKRIYNLVMNIRDVITVKGSKFVNGKFYKHKSLISIYSFDLILNFYRTWIFRHN